VVLDRRIGFLLLGACTVGGYALFGLMAPTEVEFTRPGPPSLPGLELRPSVSTLHLTLPVDLERVARRTEAAVVQRLGMGLEAGDPACAKRPAPADCAASRLEALALSGPVVARAADGAVRVRVPLRAEAGQGTERATLDLGVTFSFKVKAGGGLDPEVVRFDEPASDGPAGAVHARLARSVESRLRPLALTAQDELRAVMAELPVGAATAHAWNALSQSIDLGSGTWLRAVPEVAGIGDLVTSGNATLLRLPIAARISVEDGERGGTAPRRGVVHGQVNTSGSAVLRAATPVSLETMQPAIEAAFVKAGSLETRPDRFGPPVRVDVRRARLYPSLRQVGVELDIAASRFEGQTYLGKAHLLGRPVLDPDRGIVTLADVTLAPVPQREGAAARAAASAPRLANDPFTGKLAAVFRIDVARDTADLLPRMNGLLQRRLDDRLSISARLEAATPVSFDVSKDGGWLVTDLTGMLSLNYNGEKSAAPVARGPQRPANATVAATGAARVATPEIAAAAVMSAAAAGGAAAASATQVKPSAGGHAPALAASAAALSSTSASGPGTAVAGAEAQKAPVARSILAKKPVPRSGQQKSGTKQASVSSRRDWVPFPTNN
jgi:hypothetical protein